MQLPYIGDGMQANAGTAFKNNVSQWPGSAIVFCMNFWAEDGNK